MKLSRLLSIVKHGIDVLLSEHLQSRCIDTAFDVSLNPYTRDLGTRLEIVRMNSTRTGQIG